MRFFLDRNIPKRLSEIVSIFDRDNQVDFHDQHFHPATQDVEWIAAVHKWDPRPAIAVPFAFEFRRNQRRKRGSCLHCGYLLRTPAPNCPECGTPVELPRIVER